MTTVLSPLIESLMVVCKHSSDGREGSEESKGSEGSKGNKANEESKGNKANEENKKDLTISNSFETKTHDFSKEPIESLFFSFTEEHKKILNAMIRENPKLMSGPFSVLVRNPKVLEFDNKRAYFQKKLHESDGIRTSSGSMR